MKEDVVEKPGEGWVAETPLSAGAIGLTPRGNEAWLEKAGGERRETPEELAHRSAI